MTHLTTETAQRRLLEVLADLWHARHLDYGKCDSPLSSAAMGLRFAADVYARSGDTELVALSRLNAAVADLCEAVNDEMKETQNG